MSGGVCGLLASILWIHFTCVSSFDTQSDADSASRALDEQVIRRHQSGSFKLRTPHFSLSPHPWFDTQKELAHWNEVNARLKVFMNSRMEPEESSRGLDYNGVLKKDIALSNKLDKEVQEINAAIQSEPLISTGSREGYSLLETGDVSPDWTFCTCTTGPNGTLVFPERNWPGVELPTAAPINLQTPQNSNSSSLLQLQTASMLKVDMQGKRVLVARADTCSCANPWEEYNDPSGSSTCSLVDQVTICLIRRNLNSGAKSSEELKQEALELLSAIDSTYKTSDSTQSLRGAGSFAEVWTPFQYTF